MGRSPCCDKVGLKKGPWTPEEDQKLLAYIQEHGHGSWRALPAKAGLQRCGKSCRLRWTNYLRPDIKRGKFSLQEEQTIIQLHALLGNRWSAIATHLPKRTDNEIKNYWNTHLKKRLAKMGIDPVTHKQKNDALVTAGDGAGHSKSSANLSHMAQWESARLEAEARLVRQSKLSSSSSFQGDGGVGGGSRCLDVLKPWNSGGVWPRTGGSGGDMESPTSTLSSAAGVGENSAAFVEFVANSTGSSDVDGGGGGEYQWNHFPEYRDAGIEDNSVIPFPSGVLNEDPPSKSPEQVPRLNFAEKFTDLLLSKSFGDRRLPEDDDNAGDYCEDHKNYWNSILTLVNSSPSNSPLF